MMELNKVDHILRAAGRATGHNHFVLVGSAAIFAWETIVPPEMSQTREADLFAYDVDPDTAARIADEIDGALGQSSQFDETYGYYCDGVGPETAILAADWPSRAKTYLSPEHRWGDGDRSSSERHSVGEAVRRTSKGHGLAARCKPVWDRRSGRYTRTVSTVARGRTPA